MPTIFFSVNAYPIQFNLFIVVKCINKLTHSAVCESDLSVKVIVNIIIMVWEKVFIVGLFLKTVQTWHDDINNLHLTALSYQFCQMYTNVSFTVASEILRKKLSFLTIFWLDLVQTMCNIVTEK